MTSVMIVDDEPSVAVALRATLRSLGYEACAIAANLDDALARAAAGRPDVVLLDEGLIASVELGDPGELLEMQLGVPVIFLGANVAEAAAMALKPPSVRSVVTKPPAPGELQSAIERAVSRHRRLLGQPELSVDPPRGPIETMAVGLVHQVGGPLAAILSNAAVLEELLPAPEGEGERLAAISDALTDLQISAQRIGQVVDDLRALSSRPEPSSLTIDAVVCAEAAVRLAASEIRPRARLVVRSSEVVPVHGDEARLTRAITNLLLNAAHTIEPGDVDAHEIAVSTRMGPDGRVAISVRDTGRGYTPAQQARIFEPFFTTTVADVDSGLALAVSHGIVKAMGGEIAVRSEIGFGSTFTIHLPAAQPLSRPSATSARPKSSAPAARILVVDDDALVARALVRILDHHHVVCCESAFDAVAIIDRGQRFDLILSDVAMPGMSGIDLHGLLVDLAPDQAARMVFVTGGFLTGSTDTAFRRLPHPRISKPFDSVTVRNTVDRLLGERADATI